MAGSETRTGGDKVSVGQLLQEHPNAGARSVEHRVAHVLLKNRGHCTVCAADGAQVVDVACRQRLHVQRPVHNEHGLGVAGYEGAAGSLHRAALVGHGPQAHGVHKEISNEVVDERRRGLSVLQVELLRGGNGVGPFFAGNDVEQNEQVEQAVPAQMLQKYIE